MLNTTICCPSIEKTLLKCYNSCWHSLESHKNEVRYLTWFCFHLQMSGYLIYNNTFSNCHVGSFIGGGRRNQVFNNSYHNCSTAVHEDNRGMSWQKAFCSPVSSYKFTTAVWLHLLLVPFKHRTEIVNNSGALHAWSSLYIYYKISMCGRWHTKTTIAFQGGMFQQQLESVNYQNPPWSLEYPELVHIFQDHPCIPVYNVVANNTYCGGTFIDISAEQAKEWLDTVANNSMNCWLQTSYSFTFVLELYNSWVLYGDKLCVVFMRLCVHFNHQAVPEPWH